MTLAAGFFSTVGPFSNASAILYTAGTAAWQAGSCSFATALVISNAGPATAYVGGGTAVTSATGFGIPAGSSLVVSGQFTGASTGSNNVNLGTLWGVTAGASSVATISLGYASEVSVC